MCLSEVGAGRRLVLLIEVLQVTFILRTACAVFCICACILMQAVTAGDIDREAVTTMARAGQFFQDHLAVHGGYVYHWSLDLKERWGEGRARPLQVWVQPPATPSVGMAFLSAWKATADPSHLRAVDAAANVLVYGQLQGGGWSNSIDTAGLAAGFPYSAGQRRLQGNSSLDDGQTQMALLFLMRVDKSHEFQEERVNSAVQRCLNALFAVQFRNGAFPQVWKQATSPPVTEDPALVAAFPDYDWRTHARIKNYWDLYTLNDNVCGFLADVFAEADRIYGDPRALPALRRMGDFLLRAQMPEPQPGWAQQYDYKMRPVWARAFEPPAVASDETQEVIDTLLQIACVTGDRKYLEPLPRALAWLRRSQLPDGRLARYYELQSNRPLYMRRTAGKYELTYDDVGLPSHYGWKIESRVGQLEAALAVLKEAGQLRRPVLPERATVRAIIEQLDSQGRWVSRYNGERLVGQPKFARNQPYLSSEVFCRNMQILADYVKLQQQ